MSKYKLAGHLAGIGLLLASSAAMAETKAGADLAVSGGYASNPYGSSVSDAGSATINATFSPSVVLTSPTGATTLSGQVSHTEYAQRYTGTTDYSVSGLTTQQVSALMSFTASAGYSSQVRNALFPIFDPGSLFPNGPDDPVFVDPSGAATFTERTESLRGTLGLTATISPRDTLSASARIFGVSTPSTSAISRSYTSYGGGLSYRRAVAANTSVGLSMDVSRADYRGGRIGDSTQFSPQLVFNTKLAPRLTFDLSAGLTFSDSEVAVGSSKRTSFSGSASLCNAGERSNLCATLSRSVSPSSISGTSTLTSLGASYRYSLDTRSEISGRLSYARSRGLDTALSSDFGSAGVGYSRQLTEKLSATIDVSYNDTFNSTFTRAGNFYGTVGIRYRLGEI